MNFLNSVISENLINAIGWTIIHSLWQGAAAALGCAAVMFFLPKFGARTRHLVGVMTLMLVLVMSTITFVSIYQPGMAGITAAEANGSHLLLTDAAKIQGDATLAGFFKNYFNRHLPLLVTVWMLGVLVLVLRLAGGYLYNQRLKLHRNQPLTDPWQNRLETFCRQTRIGKPISLVESALVKIPMTIGHFKPVILFPLGLVTGLPRDQVEALLAHELAHILRKDYLVNILQSFVDILFFYHPGVRWISSQVRAEREHCCDDIAVSISGNSLNVARALTNIQGYDLRTPYPAMAAANKGLGSRGLLARIKRLVNPPVKGPGFAGGTIGAVILVVGLLVLMVSTNAAAALSRDMVNDKSPAVESVQPVDQEQEKDKEKELQKKEQERITKLESTLKAEKMELEKQLKELDPGEKEKSKILEKKVQELELKFQELETLKREQRSRIREQERVIRKEVREHERTIREEVRERERAVREAVREKEREMREQEADMRVEEAEMRKQEEKLRLQEAEMQKQQETLKSKQEELMRVQETEMRKQEAKMREQEAQLRKQEAKLRAKEAELREIEKEMKMQMEHLMEVLTNELLRDQLITDIEDFELQFKKGKLYINGKKQPDTVYKKYKDLYEQTSGKKLNEDSGFRIVNRK